MNDSLDENEELYRMLIENAMDALLICDEKVNIIYISPSMEKLSGYSKDELIGRNAFTFYHPDDVSVAKERLKTLLDGKEYSSVEFRFRKKNGDYVWAEVATKPVQTTQGDTRLIVVARDVSERKNLQEQLKKYSENLEMLVAEKCVELNKTKEYLQQLVSYLPLALVAWDKEFKVKTWNPAATQMFGFAEPEALGKSPDFILPSNQVSAVNMIWSRLMKGESANIVNENNTKDGRIITCKWTNTPLKDENGNVDGVLSMIQDITEKNKLERRLKEIVYSISGVKSGESYLMNSLQQCLKIAFDLNSHGAKCLFIVRENPDSIIKDYNFKPEDIILLSLKPIKEFKAINDLQEISITITKFLKNNGAVVVLDGLEYLISRHGFNAVFMMIQEKRFEFLEFGATLLVPVDLETLDAREKSLLSSELRLTN